MISVQNLKKSYGQLQVLKGISFSVGKGEIVALVGASGAGKSTLLHILGTLDKPDSGTLVVGSHTLGSMNDNQLAGFRNHSLGFVFQFHHLLPEFTALENVCIPAFIKGSPVKESRERAIQLLKELSLEERAHHKPSELSGGEQQRVAVARALMNNPELILADEPSGNLDSANAKDLHHLFFDLRKKYNMTFIIATHNEELASMSDRKIHMADGLIQEYSS